MPYQPYDIASKESKEFKARVRDKSHRLDQIAGRTTATEKPRPLNHLEQSATHCLYAIGEFCDSARDALSRRGKNIPRFSMRLGLLQYAARSLFNDIIGSLDQEGAIRFGRNAQTMTLKCMPKVAGQPPKESRICWDDDLCDIHEAAWRGTCMFCDKTASEARVCPLKRAFDHTMMLDPSDNKNCWWRAD